jgi:tRNA A-37 threonylcarbamoyl transferase component Bud32
VAALSLFCLLVVFVTGGVVAACFVVFTRYKRTAVPPIRPETQPRWNPVTVLPPGPMADLLAGACPVCGAALPADSPMGLCPQCLLQCALSHSDEARAPDEPARTGAFQGSSNAPAPADLAALFPQLEIQELIGQGGMGAVYRARQIKLDRQVAVKILPAEWGRDPAFAERFAREARALARLSHAHIVAVHDFGETGGLFYLVMEFVDGGNLRRLVQSGRLQPQQALAIVAQVCEALQYAHEEGVVHRDIKPENILLDKRGQVKIADFGLAKLMRRSAAEFTLTGSRQVMGTVDYMAPEQRTAPQDVDHRADIYSLGVVLYEMLTGELPLGRFAPPSAREAVPEGLDEVVYRALEQDPARRYQRISELKMDVESIARGTVVGAAPARISRPARGHLDLELTRLRAHGPAAGLAVTAILFLMQTIAIAGFCVWGEFYGGKGNGLAMPEELFWWLFGTALLAAVAVGAIMIGAAVNMARLENYGFVMVGIILAMLPFSPHAIIGLFAGGWALWVLSRPEIQAGFALNSRNRKLAPTGQGIQSTGPGGIYQRMRSAVGGMLTLIVHRPTAVSSLQVAPTGEESQVQEKARQTPVLPARPTDPAAEPHNELSARGLVNPTVGCGAFLIAVLFFFLIYFTGGFGPPSGKDGGSASKDGGSASVTWKGDPSLRFCRGDPLMLDLMVPQPAQVDEILRPADREYLEIEARHTKYAWDHATSDRTATVMPFPEELKNLEDRVWLQLETVLIYKEQLQKARMLLPLRGSLFPFGKNQVTIALNWTNDGGYRWRVLPNAGEPGTPAYQRGASLPLEYVRFWEPAAEAPRGPARIFQDTKR